MSVPISILLFGRNTRLLESRKMVLQSVGYRVYVASDLSTASRMLGNVEIDLLILCHSLPMEDRGRALALNHLCPMMRSPVLTAREDCCRDTLLTEVREAVGVPAELASIAGTFFHVQAGGCSRPLEVTQRRVYETERVSRLIYADAKCSLSDWRGRESKMRRSTEYRQGRVFARRGKREEAERSGLSLCRGHRRHSG